MDTFIAGTAANIIEARAGAIANGIAKIAKDSWDRFKVDFDFAFTKYLDKSYKKLSRIKTILYKTEPQYLYDFFEIPFLLKKQNVKFLADDANKILDISHFIIIQGIGGIGKSTLMKHLFINELQKKDLIPIYLELKDINDIDGEYDIKEHIFQKLVGLGSSVSRESLDYALKSGAFLFLLDGYDEILTEKRNSFLKKLDAFCDSFTNNYYIISSRPYSEFIELQRFSILSTCPFSKGQAISLIRKISFDEEIKKRFVDALEQELYEKHESFASNPLLLSIMLLTFDNYAEIPGKLHVFYANAFETLYEKHDATKAGFRREIRSSLSYDLFRKVFSYFCFISYAQGKTVFTRDELTELLRKITIRGLEFNSEDYIYDLANSLCVIYKDGLTYKFTHRSFQEYFTAFFLKELSDENMMKLGLQLVYRDEFRAIHDNVFSMLRDMTEDRFEENILLPVIIDFEKGIGNESKYDFYFNAIVSKIKFGNLRRDENSDDALILSSSITNNTAVFIYEYSRHHFHKEVAQDKEYNDAAKELRSYLLRRGRPSDAIEVDYEEISNNKEIYDLLKRTWIGARLMCLTSLREEIERKQQEMTLDLSSLLDI